MTYNSMDPTINVKQVMAIPLNPRLIDPYREMILYNPNVKAEVIANISPNGLFK